MLLINSFMHYLVTIKRKIAMHARIDSITMHYFATLYKENHKQFYIIFFT